MESINLKPGFHKRRKRKSKCKHKNGYFTMETGLAGFSLCLRLCLRYVDVRFHLAPYACACDCVASEIQALH